MVVHGEVNAAAVVYGSIGCIIDDTLKAADFEVSVTV
jgi:hypothetical protein